VNAENIRTLLIEKVGVRKVKQSSNWVNATCPFEKRHGGGTDEFPSFGVHIAPNRSSKFNCKSGSCGIHGDNLIGFLFALEAQRIQTREKINSLFWWVLERDNTLAEVMFRPDPSEKKKLGPPPVYNWEAAVALKSEPSSSIGVVAPLVLTDIPAPIVLPETDLNRIRPVSKEVFAYLKGEKRRYTQTTIDAWELGSQTDWYGNQRVAIPVRDFEQRLVGITGRILPSKVKSKAPKFLHTKGFRKDFFLFGESKRVEGRTCTIVEGHFDVIGLWQYGYLNVVAIMGSHPSREQVEKLARWFTDAVVFGDGDPPGRKMALDTLEAIRSRMPARIAQPIEGKDPDEHNAEELFERLGAPDRPTDNQDRF
jgi:5S rRNA maturation endonuclease (ribonuclease M5)